MLKRLSLRRFNAVSLVDEACSVYVSKVGGIPYHPQGFAYPHSRTGAPLRLLAQINLSEMPALDDFPREGMLQFYLGGDNAWIDSESAAYRVVYHEQIDKNIPQQPLPDGYFDLSFSDADDVDAYDAFPFAHEFCKRMRFQQETSWMSLDDFRIQPYFEQCWYELFGESITEYYEEKVASATADFESYIDLYDKGCHRVGGYPLFSQDDPRGDSPEQADKEVQLLQLASDWVQDFDSDLYDDPRHRLMWGDCGLGHFFISHRDLLDRRFDRVLFAWDCG